VCPIGTRESCGEFRKPSSRKRLLTDEFKRHGPAHADNCELERT
jgi:hypothetical protein